MTTARVQLTLHVGLPKTGTTTLQRHVFPKYGGYICGTDSTGNSKVLADGLHALYQVKGGHRDWSSRAWRAEVEEWCRVACTFSSAPLFVSLEGLFRWFDPQTRQPWPFLGDGRGAPSSRVGQHPIVHFLDQFQAAAQDLELRTVLTLRNQSDFLGSLYAQLSYRMRSPSQQDFERKVQHLISRRDPFLNWNQTVSDIARTIGPQNLKVVLFEDGLNTVAQEITNFVSPTWQVSNDLQNLRHNTRSNSLDGWKLTTRRNILVRSLPRGPVRALRTALLQDLNNRDGKYLHRAEHRSRSPQNTIQIPTGLRRAIRSAYAEGNQVLAEYLQRDLINAGY